MLSDRAECARTEHDLLARFDAIAAPLVAGLALAAALAEARWPLRRRTCARRRRWPTNGAFGALAAALVRLAALPAMVRAAERAGAYGLLARAGAAGLPRWARVALGLALLDASLYAWHRANHRVALLWRFHAVHHVDPDLDVTTALRFHVGELALSIPARCVVVAALGVGPREVVAYELAMQAATTLHHADVRLPARLESALSWLVITPRLHGAHHGRRSRELASNFGVVLSVWDRLFGTRRARFTARQPRVGVPRQPPDGVATRFSAALRMPFG